MMQKKIQGVVVPLLTPQDEVGSIKLEEYKKLARYCVKNGVGTLFLMGTAGEGHALSEDEKLKALRAIVTEFDSQATLVCGVLEPSTSKAMQFIKAAEGCGIHRFAVVPPYYDEATEEDLFDHYRKISAALSNDSILYIYNIPGTTGVDIGIDLVKRIKALGNVGGIKNSATDLFQFIQLIEAVQDEDFSVLQGYEELAVAGLLFGADGVVPCGGNVYPKFFQIMYVLSQKNAFKKLLDIEKTARRVLDVQVFASNWRVSLKAAVEQLGVADMGILSVPSQTLITNEERNALGQYLHDMKQEVHG